MANFGGDAVDQLGDPLVAPPRGALLGQDEYERRQELARRAAFLQGLTVGKTAATGELATQRPSEATPSTGRSARMPDSGSAPAGTPMFGRGASPDQPTLARRPPQPMNDLPLVRGGDGAYSSPRLVQPAAPIALPGEVAAIGAAARPALARYENFEARPVPEYQAPKPIAGWKSALGTAGSLAAGLFYPAAGRVLYGRTTNAGRQAAAQRQFDQAIANRSAEAGELLKAAQAENAAMGKPTEYQFKTVGGHLWSLAPRTGKKVNDLGPIETTGKVSRVETDDQGNAVAVMEDGTVKQLSYRPQTKPKTFTNPFEAYAYGTPDEKQAAQNFVNAERRAGARYRNPTEIEERYRLYKSDPTAYGAMFGQKGGPGGISQATATRMLNYFDKRRREISGDFTLSDQDKAQQLASIDQLEQPFMDAARGQGTAPAGGETITVINKQGVTGTVPIGNLKRALKQGYRLAPQQ